jgi:glycerate-2-kinase
MHIKNFQNLASSQLRKDALLIAEAGLTAINTEQAFERNFVYHAPSQVLKLLGKRYALAKFKNIYCVAFGKASFAGMASVAKLLGSKLTAGFAIDVSHQTSSIPNIQFRTGTHPHPSEQNVKATQAMEEFLSRVTAHDLVLCLISGGGSALLCYPHNVSVEDQARILKELMNSGANIFEMNAVRKHLSLVKGGQLAKLIYPAKLISLIFSDVPGNDLSTIASGPTVPDKTTVKEAQGILERYNILKKVGITQIELRETPKDHKYFQHVENLLFVSAKTALKAMREKAEDLGYETQVFNEQFQGEVKKLSQDIIKVGNKKHLCWLGAGESTVEVKGKGVGGRNQELALRVLPFLHEDQVFLSLASDGHDNSDSAGAIVDALTLARAKNLNLNLDGYLQNNDSFNFLEAVGDGLHTGLTGSNVADLFIWLNK